MPTLTCDDYRYTLLPLSCLRQSDNFIFPFQSIIRKFQDLTFCLLLAFYAKCWHLRHLWNTPLTNCINYLEDSIVQNLIIPIFGLPIIDNNFKALLRDFWPTPRLKTLPETRDKNLSHPRWNWENVANTSLLWLQQLLSEFTELVHLILAVINVRRWYFLPLL